jgi:REP element-mobilizing transposase RayT
MPLPSSALVAEPGAHDASPQPAWPAAGHAHFLTVGTLFRRPLFLDPDAARAVSRSQSDPAIWGRSRCLAWVLMPDRWHGLVVLAEGDSLDPLVRRFKAITARGVEPRFRVNGWLWSKGYNQRLLDREEDLLAVARHLVANPVRAGLASSVGSYPYWNSAWLDGKRRAGDAALLLAGA